MKPQLPVTISAWVEDDPDYSHFAFKNNFQHDHFYGIGLAAYDNGCVSVQFGDGGITQPESRRSKLGSSILTPETWYHIADIVRGATDMEIYVNGINDGGIDTGTGGAMAYNNGSGNIGRSDSSRVSQPNYFHGIGDGIRFYNRALTNAEIQALYNLAD